MSTAELPRTLKITIVWLVLGTLVFLGFQAWLARQRQMQFRAADGAVELQRAPDGHFHWPGRLNGIAVDFLVDTGATRTALPQALAEQAGLVHEGDTQSATAGGTVRGWQARADLELQGGVSARGLKVTVLPRLEAPLLGMDVLSKMRFSQQAGVLRFEPAGR